MKGIDRGIRNFAKVFNSLSQDQRREIAVFSEIYTQSPDLKNFLKAPHLSVETKGALIQKVFSPHFQVDTTKFIQFLLEKERLKDLPQILQSFDELNGKKIASLVSTEPLSETIVKQIQSQLNAATGNHYELKSTLDKKLIGGFLVKADNRIFDGSIKNSLALLKRQLGKAACS